MITKTQYRLLVDNYMEKYNISQNEAEFLINKHKMEYYINALTIMASLKVLYDLIFLCCKKKD